MYQMLGLGEKDTGVIRIWFPILVRENGILVFIVIKIENFCFFVILNLFLVNNGVLAEERFRITQDCLNKRVHSGFEEKLKIFFLKQEERGDTHFIDKRGKVFQIGS